MVTLLVAQTVGNLYLPNFNADIINGGVVTGNIGYIWRTGGIMLGITLAVGAIGVVAVYWASRVAMGVGADLRAAVFTRVQAFSAREVNRFGTASLITRNTNDIQQIQLFLQMALMLMVIAPIMSVGGVIMALKEGLALSPLLGVAVPVMAVVIGGMVIFVVPQFRTMPAAGAVDPPGAALAGPPPNGSATGRPSPPRTRGPRLSSTSVSRCGPVSIRRYRGCGPRRWPSAPRVPQMSAATLQVRDATPTSRRSVPPSAMKHTARAA